MLASGLKNAARHLPAGHASSAPACRSAGAAITTVCVGTAQLARQCTQARSTQQRRHSSSKASCPPGDRPDGPRAPTATEPKAAADGTAQTSKAGRVAGSERGPTLKSSRRKAREQAQEAQKAARSARGGVPGKGAWYENLPSVPNTDSISQNDIKLSSLFALHRPLTLHAPIPPPIEQADFERLFARRASSEAKKTDPAEVLSTLQNTINNLSHAHGENHTVLHWKPVTEIDDDGSSESVRHLDGTPVRVVQSVEDFVARLKPYDPPAPPEPSARQTRRKSNSKASSGADTSNTAQKRQASTAQQQRAFKTTMIVRDLGQDGYTAEVTSITPFNEEQQQQRGTPSRSASSARHRASPAPATSAVGQLSMPFGRRARISRILAIRSGTHTLSPQVRRVYRLPSARTASSTMVTRISPDGPTKQQRVSVPPMTLRTIRDGKMFALSVKRQRKLKMKKHKYKKLMRRTRTLRRKLDK